MECSKLESDDDRLGIISALFAETRQVEWVTQLKLDRIINEFGFILMAILFIELLQLSLSIWRVLAHGG